MYRIEGDEVAQQQLDDLPPELLTELASLITLLELQPWSGAPYNKERPSSSMRLHALGEGRCDVIHLIVEDQRRVLILRLSWLDL